jgi:sugar phosphate isomerase/epimerase
MSALAYRTALGSYAYRYAVGFDGFTPDGPMDSAAFLRAAHELGFAGVQLCENLHFDGLSDADLDDLKRLAHELGLFVEVGMKEMNASSLRRHIDLATRLGSRLVRVVLGDDYSWQRADTDRERAIAVLRDALPICHARDLTIGLENRFDLYSTDLVRIVETIADDRLKLILDTTNGIGFVEHPATTLAIFGPHLISLHVKDVILCKVESQYRMQGTVLGEGWLDVPTLVAEAVAANPELSIVLEMTIGRQPEQSAAETVAWEQSAIEHSTQVLQSILHDLGAGPAHPDPTKLQPTR